MKTNAVRLLDEMGIQYELREYEVDPEDLTAETVAAKIGLPLKQVFKTWAGGRITMKCPCCGKQPLTFGEWLQGVNAAWTDCRSCGHPLKANKVTWAWFLGCVLALIVFFVSLFANIPNFIMPDSVGRLALWGFIFFCAAMSWFTGGYEPAGPTKDRPAGPTDDRDEFTSR
jgi:hypothetical protein